MKANDFKIGDRVRSDGSSNLSDTFRNITGTVVAIEGDRVRVEVDDVPALKKYLGWGFPPECLTLEEPPEPTDAEIAALFGLRATEEGAALPTTQEALRAFAAEVWEEGFLRGQEGGGHQQHDNPYKEGKA